MQNANFKCTFYNVILLMLFLCLLTPNKTFAAEQTLRVSPVIINIALSPDKTYNHEITIENLTNAPMPLKASFNDFITSGEEGGYIFENTRTSPLLSWTQLNETEFILKSHEKKRLQLVIKTPKTIPLGGYYGILFFEPVVQNAVQNATRVSSKIGILMLANVGVPDPNTPKAELLSFSLGQFHSDGNLPLVLRVKNISLNFFTAKPLLTLTPFLKLPSSHEDKHIVLDDKIIFPGQVRRWTEDSVVQNLSPNIYKAHLAVSTGDGHYVSKDTHFIVFPFAKTLGVAGVLLFIVFIISKRKRLKKAATALFR